jgi:hypothetical protein
VHQPRNIPSTQRVATKSTKINPPKEFSGGKEECKAFVRQLKLYILAKPEEFRGDDVQKIAFALSFMKGGAELWASRVLDTLTEEAEQPEYNHYSDQDTEELSDYEIETSTEGSRYRMGRVWNQMDSPHSKYYFAEWPPFLRALVKKFSDPDPANMAITELEACKQGTCSVDDFVTEFDSIAADTGFNDEALIRYFQTGLHHSIFDRVWAMDTPPTTLEGWEEKARHFDHLRITRDSVRPRQGFQHPPQRMPQAQPRLVYITGMSNLWWVASTGTGIRFGYPSSTRTRASTGTAQIEQNSICYSVLCCSSL